MRHYKVQTKSKKSLARTGRLVTAHGQIETPFFMPIATKGAVKHLTTAEAKKLGAEILLSNTYHLMLRPGEKLIKRQGGLHKFMDWSGPILTDSGGFQVFSLAGTRHRKGEKLVKLTERGVKFNSYIDGARHELTPERAIKIQADLGVDIAVCLDECVALPAEKHYLEASVELTSRWAKRSRDYWRKLKGKKPLLFAVVQGGLDKKLRLKSLDDLTRIGFDGYNIGGLSVGESDQEMSRVLDYLVPEMPVDAPRYLMGVGYPEQIVRAVRHGVDMFDCVIPTREGRHGRLFLWMRNHKSQITKPKQITNHKAQTNLFSYETINITNAKFATDKTPINPRSKLPELRGYSRGYLNHLFKTNEPLGLRLASLHNLEFYLDLMTAIRQAIIQGKI